MKDSKVDGLVNTVKVFLLFNRLSTSLLNSFVWVIRLQKVY